MKIHSELRPHDSSASAAIHRAVQGRYETSKSYGNRYERRKVRQCLRRAEIGLD